MLLGSCSVCGKEIKISPSQEGRKKYCSIGHRNTGSLSGSQNGRFIGGNMIKHNHHAKTDDPQLFWWDRDTKSYEHRNIAEKALQRKMKYGEVVHHIDGDSLNNVHTNLLICTRSYHARLHTKMSQLYMIEHFRK